MPIEKTYEPHRRVNFHFAPHESDKAYYYNLKLLLIPYTYNFWEFFLPIKTIKELTIELPKPSLEEVDSTKNKQLAGLKNYLDSYLKFYASPAGFLDDYVESFKFYYIFRDAVDWCINKKYIMVFCDQLQSKEFDDTYNDQLQIILSIEYQNGDSYTALSFPFKARGKNGELKKGRIQFEALTAGARTCLKSDHTQAVDSMARLFAKHPFLKTEFANRIADAVYSFGSILVKALEDDDLERAHFNPEAYDRYLKNNREKLKEQAELGMYRLCTSPPRCY